MEKRPTKNFFGTSALALSLFLSWGWGLVQAQESSNYNGRKLHLPQGFEVQRQLNSGFHGDVFLLKGPSGQLRVLKVPTQQGSQSAHRRAIAKEVSKKHKIWKKLGLYSGDVTFVDPAHKSYGVTKPYISGGTLFEHFSKQNFLTGNGEKKQALVKMMADLVRQGVFVSDLKGENMAWDPQLKRWQVFDTSKIKEGLTPEQAMAKYRADLITERARWTRHFASPQKELLQQLLQQVFAAATQPAQQGCSTSAGISSPLDGAAAAGFQSHQYALKQLKQLGGEQVVSSHKIARYKDRVSGEEVWIKGGPEHTTRADFVGTRIFQLMGLPTPKTSLILTEKGPKLAMEYLKGFDTGLPQSLANSEVMQLGLFADLLIYNYDRNHSNIMNDRREVVFIDQGASLTSKARGGDIEFPRQVTLEQVAKVISGPGKVGLKNVNISYPKVVNLEKLLGGQLVFNRQWAVKGVEKLKALSDSQIDAVVEAGYGDLTQKQSKKQVKARLRSLKKKYAFKKKQETFLAIQTLKEILERHDGNQASYFQQALKSRRDSLIKLFESGDSE